MVRPTGRSLHLLAPAGVVLVLLLSAWPTIDQPANPQHLDTARAFLHGSLWIDQPTQTHDLGEIAGRWFAPFPPLPALLATACLLISAHSDLIYNLLVTAAALGAVCLAWRLGRRLGGPAAGAWASLAIGLGSGLWIATALHDTYHSAHVFSVVLSLGAVTTVLTRRPRWRTAGVLIGIAALSRQAVILGTPWLAWLPRRCRGLRRSITMLLLGALVPFSLYLGLNLLRFGSPLRTGYGLVHHAPRLAADLASHGVFSLSYLPRNLGIMLAARPHHVAKWPYLLPDPAGMSLLLVSPWVILTVVALVLPDRPSVRRVAGAALAGAVAISVPSLLYINTGWAQFGYRFALDALPLLLPAAVLAMRRTCPRLAWALVAWSVLVNAWGYVALRHWHEWVTLLPQ